MSQELVKRWLEATQPLQLGLLKEKMGSSYAKALGMPQEETDRLLAAIKGVDEKKLWDHIVAFAEENFSEDALKPAVEFFESEAGKKYMEQRRTVLTAAEGILSKVMAESVKAAYGL